LEGAFGLGVNHAFKLAKLLEDLDFDAASPLETPPVLGDFFDEHRFALVRRRVVVDEFSAEGVVLGGVLALDHDLGAGETVPGCVVPAVGNALGRSGTGGQLGVGTVGENLSWCSHVSFGLSILGFI
jgi:hypothetical protein